MIPLQASPFILRIRARDRAVSYITFALSLPIVLFGLAAGSALIGIPMDINAFRATMFFCAASFISLGMLMLSFQFYCWCAFNYDLRNLS